VGVTGVPLQLLVKTITKKHPEIVVGIYIDIHDFASIRRYTVKGDNVNNVIVN
jgi:hypothetical protein